MLSVERIALLFTGCILAARALTSWISDPIARHSSCNIKVNTPSVCYLFGYDSTGLRSNITIKTLPSVGMLYETSTNFRIYGTEPKRAPDPIGPHLLPFQVTDPMNRIIYVPPVNRWPTEGFWSSFLIKAYGPAYYVDDSGTNIELAGFPPRISEDGLVVLSNPDGGVVGSAFDAAGDGGWSISGNFVNPGANGGSLQHQPFGYGSLYSYLYAVDEVQSLDFETGIDQAKWYFEASPSDFYKPEVVAAYGGKFRFKVRSLYGDFSRLNGPLDWVTLECDQCNSGRGLRIVRFVDDHISWDGSEKTVELSLLPGELWQRDPLNDASVPRYCTECEIAAVLTNLSRVAILGDFTLGGEGVAIDDVAFVAADEDSQPGVPLACLQGCACKYEPGATHPQCC